MKNKRTTLLILQLLILAGLVVLMIELVNRGSSSARNVVQSQSSPPISTSGSIPPAPPPLQPLKGQGQNGGLIASRQNTSADSIAKDGLLYDESLSFDDNIHRLKKFCDLHQNDPELGQLIDQFLKVFFGYARGQFAAVKHSLEELDGTTAYRNILLACLTVADGPISEKADIVWLIAMSKESPIETRRMATHLTLQFSDGKSRSDELFSLLNDSDSDIVILALKVAPLQMDDRSYNLIKTTLLNSTDVNIQIAAVDAIGSATNVDRQAELLEIIGNQKTSKDNMFSDASLLKRRAVSHLEINDPQSHDLIKHIALDGAEDPGVRANAISRFTAVDFPEATDLLLNLLQTLKADDAVMLAAIEDNLLTTPNPNIVQAIQTKAEGLSDPQLRSLMIKRLEKITKGMKQ